MHKNRTQTEACCVSGCNGSSYGKSLCRKHYTRYIRGNDPFKQNNRDKTVASRIEERIERITESGCWVWMGTTNSNGYGNIWNGERNVYVHRWMYEDEKGEIPEGYVVMHSCDNPSCCNPSHLNIGTQADNIADARKKGRIARGTRSPQYKHGKYCVAY